MRAVLISRGRVFAPEDLGVQDILLAGDKITMIAPEIERSGLDSVFREIELVDASGAYVVPGFVDQHVHMNGGGGEGGPINRTPESRINEYIAGGVTSAIGLMGTDAIGRSLESLLLKARCLEAQGISTWILSGSYGWPPVTLTGSVIRDLTIVDKVIGVKVALSDHRSSHPDIQSIRTLVSQARLGGITAGKAGIVAVHVGAEQRGLGPILEALDGTDIPVTQFAPTHLGRSPRLLSEAVEFAHISGYVDFTCRGESTAETVRHALKQGASIERITVSSDGHGSCPVFNENGELEGISMHGLTGIHDFFQAAVSMNILSVCEAVRMCSTNTAQHYMLHGKGRLEEGSSGDVLVLDGEDYSIRDVIAKGRILMRSEQVLEHGRF